MQKILSHPFSGLAVFFTVIVIYSCSKGGGGTTSPNPCSGITITVTGTISNPATAGTATGSIVASASGSAGITYSINGGSFQSSGTFSGLLSGNYTITAKNNNGCSGSASFILTDPPGPCSGVTIVVSGTITNPSAAGTNDGNIIVSASGSSGFMYSLNGGVFQAGGSFNSLGAGSYTVIARDLNNCTGSGTFILSGPNPCAGVTIIVNPVVTGNTPCEPANGSLSLSASGGAVPYEFNLNGGAFQSSNIFSNLSAGNYTVIARDLNGCSNSSNVIVSNLPAGTLFSAVRIVLQNNCVPCHNNTQSEGGMNWTIDCNIIAFRDRIQARAVAANPSSMPPTGLLPVSERQKITDWINAGGRYTN